MATKPPAGPAPDAGVTTSREGQFLASLSHELRTPLNGVLGMAGLLADTRLDDDQRAYLTAIRESGEHLLGLVNDVLDLARLEAGKLNLARAPVDAEAMLQSICELLSPRAHGKGLEIAWTAPCGAPRALSDDGRLRQILFNLAGNAVKFTASGGVILGLEVAPLAGDRARLRFEVKDTGPGVAEADQERIFEAFAQGRDHGGHFDSTGLGLAIVRRLVDGLGGRLGLDSSPGRGSTFWFEIDCDVAAPGVAGARLDGIAVGVASPSPIVREAAARQVEACGGRAIAAIDLAAPQLAEAQVVLVDGALAAGPRRTLKPISQAPHLVLLAPEQRGRIQAWRRVGFAGYLIKPLRRQSLATRILAVTGQAADTGARRPMDDERAAPAAARGTRVLLAEDNPINAMLARALLEREGCVVERTTTGPETVEVAASGGFDLILMDLRMPGLDGLTATRQLRARGLTTPIAALTADAFEDDRRACLAAGMDGFLPKPLDPQALRALLVALSQTAFTDRRPVAKLAC
jgi:CheY-like chemotaxis protein